MLWWRCIHIQYFESLGDATLADGEKKGQFFDTTLGGEKFFTNGNNQSIEPAAARPVIIKVSGEARGTRRRPSIALTRFPPHVTNTSESALHKTRVFCFSLSHATAVKKNNNHYERFYSHPQSSLGLTQATMFENRTNPNEPERTRTWTDELCGEEPVPGICKGLKRGVEGMRVGGTRTISVPPELGFGNAAVRSPYAVAWVRPITFVRSPHFTVNCFHLHVLYARDVHVLYTDGLYTVRHVWL